MSVVRTAWSRIVLVHVSWSELIHRQFCFSILDQRLVTWYRDIFPRTNFTLPSTTKFLSPVQTDTTLLANLSHHCWMLHLASVCTPCCTLLRFVESCSQKLENGGTCKRTQQLSNLGQQCCIGLHGALGAGQASIPDNPALSLRLGLQVHCLPNSKTELFENVLIQALRISVDGKHFEKGTFRKHWRPQNNNHVISLATFRSFRQ